MIGARLSEPHTSEILHFWSYVRSKVSQIPDHSSGSLLTLICLVVLQGDVTQAFAVGPSGTTVKLLVNRQSHKIALYKVKGQDE